MFDFFNKKQLDLEKVRELFDGATELPDEVYLAAIEISKTGKEKRMMLVAEFHRSFLNGGPAGAFSYYLAEARNVITSYRKLGLTKYSEIISKSYWVAIQGSATSNATFIELDEKMAEFDEEYSSLCYKDESRDELEIALCAEIMRAPRDYYNILSNALNN